VRVKKVGIVYVIQEGRFQADVLRGVWLLCGQPFSGEVVDLATGQPVAGACEPLLDPPVPERQEPVEPADYPDDEAVDVYPAPCPDCPICGGPGVELGKLGRYPWRRCGNCGWDWCVED
jgi:hypothetical protein